MGENFGPDLLVSVIGAVFGSVLTVAIALVTFLIQRRRSEKQALQSLINEIHHRRALIDHGQPRTVPDAAETDDYRRCASSVMSIRDEIRRTRDVVRPGSPAQPVLSQMTRSCNGYLDAAAAQPPRYWIELMVLRERLSDSITTISSRTHGVKFAQPGIGPTIVGGSRKHGGADLGPSRAKEAWLSLSVDGRGIADEVPSSSTPIDHIPRLTLQMVARVQGFPAEWAFRGKKTSVYRQIGNAFPPPVASALGISIASALRGPTRRYVGPQSTQAIKVAI